MLPFTREQFISVFVEYNLSIWPVQILAYLIGLAMVAMLLRPTSVTDRMIAGGLAAMWFWTGIGYFGVYFSSINEAALAFGALFALQGALFVYVGVVRGRLRFGLPNTAISWLGGSLMLYAAAVYPLIGIWVGHGYPEMPMFGITPCPVTIFTFGFLLLTTAPVSSGLLAIPFAWTLVGGSAAFLLGIPQDWLLLFTGLIAVPLLVQRGHSRPGSAARS